MDYTKLTASDLWLYFCQMYGNQPPIEYNHLQVFRCQGTQWTTGSYLMRADNALQPFRSSGNHLIATR